MRRTFLEALEGKGYAVGHIPSKGMITVSEYMTSKKYAYYSVIDAIQAGKSVEDMVQEIDALIDQLSQNPKTPPEVGQQPNLSGWSD